MVPEAPFEESEYGLVAAGEGWFVLNAKEARWRHRKGWGNSLGFQGETIFPQLGMGLVVLAPGEPNGMYHWEADQEGFLVLSGEALLIVEGQERPLRQWDYVHCPPDTNHVVVGAGDEPCVIFAVGARARHTYRTPDGGMEGLEGRSAYTVSEAAIRHGAGVDEETADPRVAYARFPPTEFMRYREGLLPD